MESLGVASVHLRIYYWLDGSQYSWQKVRSSIIRLVKRAFQAKTELLSAKALKTGSIQSEIEDVIEMQT